MVAFLIISFLVFVAVASGSALTNSGSDLGGASAAPPTDLGGMMFLSTTDIASLALNAGFQGFDAATAVAIAMAESSGDPNAYNPETQAGTPQGMGSYGLWQIYLKMHPEYTAEQLLDPQTNANAAYSIYTRAGYQFTPWSTFKGGQYLAHIDEASQAVNV